MLKLEALSLVWDRSITFFRLFITAQKILCHVYICFICLTTKVLKNGHMFYVRSVIINIRDLNYLLIY